MLDTRLCRGEYNKKYMNMENYDEEYIDRIIVDFDDETLELVIKQFTGNRVENMEVNTNVLQVTDLKDTNITASNRNTANCNICNICGIVSFFINNLLEGEVNENRI